MFLIYFMIIYGFFLLVVLLFSSWYIEGCLSEVKVCFFNWKSDLWCVVLRWIWFIFIVICFLNLLFICFFKNIFFMFFCLSNFRILYFLKVCCVLENKYLFKMVLLRGKGLFLFVSFLLFFKSLVICWYNFLLLR